MNQDFIEGQTDLELVEVDSIVDSLSTWIEQGAEDIVTFLVQMKFRIYWMR